MGPSVSFPLPPRIAKKLPIRNSWELISGKLPIPLPFVNYFELIRGFEKGLAGGGWQPAVPKMQQKMPPRIVLSCFTRGHRKKAWIYGVGGISLRQPPLSANPFSKLLN